MTWSTSPTRWTRTSSSSGCVGARRWEADPGQQRPARAPRRPVPRARGQGGRGLMTALRIAQEPAADQVLAEHPFALLAGMMLDQQFPMERAFAGPAKILERFGSLDPAVVAAADPAEFAALCAVPPAVHRFPGSMAARIQQLASHRRRRVRRPRRAALAGGRLGRGAAQTAPGAPGLRQAEGADLRRPARQAARRTPRGLGERRGRLRRGGRPPVGRRRRRPGVAGQGASVQEGEETSRGAS